MEVSGKTGEAMSVKRVAQFQAPGGDVGEYRHHNGQVGVLVELAGAEGDEVAALARDIALHIASADPIAVTPADIPLDVIERERRIAEEQVAQEGKPEAIRAKIVDGKLRKFAAERSLLEQPFVKDESVTIGRPARPRAGGTGGPVRPLPDRGCLMALAYRRALLKVSGEALAGDKGAGLDFRVIGALADDIKHVHALGVHLGLVVGGGNIVRGATASGDGLDRVSADYMGMLATVINALALQNVLETLGVQTRVMTAIRMESLAEPYIRRRMHPAPGKGAAGDLRRRHRQPVLLHRHGGGAARARDGGRGRSSRPPTSTASTPPTRARIDGAEFIPELSFQDAMVNGYAVMDANAFGLCQANQLADRRPQHQPARRHRPCPSR